MWVQQTNGEESSGASSGPAPQQEVQPLTLEAAERTSSAPPAPIERAAAAVRHSVSLLYQSPLTRSLMIAPLHQNACWPLARMAAAVQRSISSLHSPARKYVLLKACGPFAMLTLFVPCNPRAHGSSRAPLYDLRDAHSWRRAYYL